MIFLCGCNSEQKIAQGYSPRFHGKQEVCPEHGEPEYGYKTKEDIQKGILTVPKGV